MADFEALIKARLDTSSVPGQIKNDIETLPVTLENVTVNANMLRKEIEAALGKSFDININPVIGNAGIKNATKSMTNASQKLSESIKFKIDTGGITASISQVEAQFEKLSNLDFPNIKSIENHLENLRKFRDILDPSKIAGMSVEDLLAQYKAYSKALTTFKNDLTVLRTTGTKLADPIKSISLDNKMQAWMKKNTKAAKEYGTVIEGLRNELKKLDLTDDELSIIDKKWGALKLDAAAKGLTGKSLFDQVKSAATQMLGFVSVGEVINVAVRGFEEMYQAVYDIDTAMTNLKKVTDETDKTYEAFLERSAASAQKLGRSVSSLVEQTATWSKLGYSLTDAEDLSKLSSIYANVAEVDDATAVSDMVTAMKAFGIETNNAVTVVDVLNELGNRFAVSAADLGTGLTKSASAMNAAGTDMYKTLAMLTGGSEITQDAGEFGSFLKVASMRLRGKRLFMPTICESKGLQASINYYAA